ncbi:MAG: isochorismatase family protein [Sphingomonas sp.]
MADHPPLVPGAERTALVLVDLQNFALAHDWEPRNGREIVAGAARLADACRAAGILVVLVRAGGGAIRLTPPVDQGYPPLTPHPEPGELPPELGPKPGDVVVTKYNLGAFYDTDLDAQLRRRGITTVLIGGVSTAFGVEGTARHAHERNYHVVMVSDVIGAFTQAEHDAALTHSLPRIARVRTADQIIAELDAGQA